MSNNEHSRAASVGVEEEIPISAEPQPRGILAKQLGDLVGFDITCKSIRERAWLPSWHYSPS